LRKSDRGQIWDYYRVAVAVVVVVVVVIEDASRIPISDHMPGD